ncbi:nuclear transport factor 2 family protein [Flagellimonas nanhaiensis]|uniref:Nuclear transport factor 2 family protein n=1 Tax=Flagellimonas nanhaiensis TaxID=2292706 RepID=A0A371JKZ9_9FLAO|nr:hypothetical protein [Allomuricauda nanhaiensis]RDY57623.1 hypothetical protein DX873_18030 [Allomuricauda nanhaiensis]
MKNHLRPLSSQNNSRNRFYILLFFLQLGVWNVNAQEKTRSEIALEYINAYYAQDSALYSIHMQDSIRWSDPTSKEIGTAITEVKGKQAVLSHLSNISRDIVSMDFKMDNSFFSDIYAIFEGFLNYSWQDFQTKKIYHFNIRTVMVLKFDGKKIVEHIDYADFKALKKQFGAQR